jgi:invasion protein IalB
MTERACAVLLLSLGLLTTATSAPAFAQAAPAAGQPTELGTFKDWNAYAAPTKTGKVCYALSQPKRSRPSASDRKDVYFFISNRPKENVRNEVSVIVGYPVRQNSDVEVDVDNAEFKLYSRDDGAFVRSNEEQAELVNAMRTGKRDMTIKSTSTRGRVTTDSYSLSGVSAAIDRINRECP